MKIPYGLSNFKDVITQGHVYIDKTDYIAKLEDNGKYHFLLRPRRFGKSLFISMLEHYYDVKREDEFDTLFGSLHIGRQPTPLKNGYQVLFMEFSGIETDGGHEALYRDFNRKIANALQRFLQRYEYPADTLAGVEQEPSPQARMEYFFRIVAGQKVLLLIDEYDHFANGILGEDLRLFQSIVGKGGFVRSFYETIKAATQQGVVDRMFVTGVTPLMLDSLTSGFNIGVNLSVHEDFNSTLGFTQTETASLLQPLVDACGLDADALLEEMAQWYNGYRFHPRAQETIYNSNMVLYFVSNFRLDGCRYPEQMLDENIASDYRKIMALFCIGNRDANYQVLDELLNTGQVTARQQRKFELDKDFSRDDFISLLAYMGFITISGSTLTQTVFAIPNHVIRELYFQYFRVELERRNQISIPIRTLDQAIEALALQDDIQPLASEMQRVLQLLSNRDLMKMDEKHVKTLLLTLLYQSPVYFIQSEREMNQKYPDIMLLERSPYEVPHQHLIELKYSKKGDGEKGWETKRQKGIEQVRGYLQLPAIAALPKLSAWLLVTDGEQVEHLKLPTG
ncbi:MAG: ATP-binding protein [Gammaproteobacteria bacterium]|nr:ATP-binding protein [Gammaproteobacteria bacterium]MBU1723640.1 ATP-binding protein [Gammaproteobacteria bacterium]MBU2005636.1 ATP-binding protein [Gammaproteobacteria bacterium]